MKSSQFILLFFISAVLLHLLSCSSHDKELQGIIKSNLQFPSEEGKQVEILYTDSGLVRLRITSPQMNHFTINIPEPYTEMPKGVFIEFFNDSGKVKTTLKADYGIRYERNKRTEVKSHVVVINSEGEILNTEKLSWNEGLKKIYTEDSVTITRKKEILHGKGLEANEDFSEYEIRNIRGSTRAPGDTTK